MTYEPRISTMPLFVATADKTITNTTTETTALSSSFIGTGLTIPAGRLQTGTIIRIKGGGVYSTPLVSSANIMAKVTVGSASVSNTTSTLLGSLTASAWDFDVLISMKSTGTTALGAVTGGSNFSTGLSSSRAFLDMVNGGTDVTLDTTVTNTVNVTLKWSVANAGYSVTVKNALLTLVN
jgi:hypothetical protein